MTDVEEVANEVDQEAEFEAGFNRARGDEPDVVEPVAEETAAAPEEETVTLNQTEIKSLLSRLDDLDKLKRGQDTAFGKLGSLQETITRLQSANASGGPVELTDEDVADLSEFPELQATMRSVLQKTLSRVRPGPAQSAFDPTPLVQEIHQLRAQREADTRQLAALSLTTQHKDWREVVNGDSFRVWLGTQPEDYRQRISESWDADEISTALDNFKAQTTRAAASKQKKTDRLLSAVQPTGVRSPDTSALDENEAFARGFRRVRGS